MNLEQEEYCFDVCMDDEGASLLKNTVEQSFTEKLRSLLVFGPNSRRYKDVYDIYYLKGIADKEKMNNAIEMLILEDTGMREKSVDDIISRISATFQNEQYLSRVSGSRQRWLDEDIHAITQGIVEYLQSLK